METKLTKKERNAKWAAENPEKVKASCDKYRANNREKEKQRQAERRAKNPGYMKEYYRANKEKFDERRREWRAANPEAEKPGALRWKKANPDKVAAAYSRWARANRDVCNAIGAKRSAAKILATPSWVDEFIVSEMYELASLRSKATGVVWHVDHIVPLRSDLVCGLHCEHNMQVITGLENCSKGNRHWPDMP